MRAAEGSLMKEIAESMASEIEHEDSVNIQDSKGQPNRKGVTSVKRDAPAANSSRYLTATVAPWHKIYKK